MRFSRAIIIKCGLKVFVGDCVDILDYDNGIFNDATEMQQIVDGGIPISKEDFLKQIVISNDHKKLINKSDVEFFYNLDKQIFWFYIPDIDIHYFYY